METNIAPRNEIGKFAENSDLVDCLVGFLGLFPLASFRALREEFRAPHIYGQRKQKNDPFNEPTCTK